MKHWWKVLSVLLLLYVFTAGLLVPLSTGIMEVSPSKASTGSTLSLSVRGYNSFFKEAEQSNKAWLKKGEDYAICANTIKVEGDNKLNLNFDIPSDIPFKEDIVDFTLLISNDKDGYALYPDAVFIQKDSINLNSTAQACTIEGVNLDEKAVTFPFRNILEESIRNLYFHVPLWFAMIIVLLISLIYSIRYLRSNNLDYDIKATAYAEVGILLGILGTVTGALWAKYTWGAYWSFDVKQNMTAVCLLIYFAYFVLRGSFDEFDKKARISATYNIFAFAMLIPLLFVIPRMVDSLHPGNGGNPAFSNYDLDSTMRLVFYPAVIGWILFGTWLSTLRSRIGLIQNKQLSN